MIQDLAQKVQDVARGVVNDIHTAIPGKIVSYDSLNNLAVIQPVGRFMTMNKKSLEYPRLTDVPLAFPYSQNAGVGITFPVKAGDSCIVIISEVELDQWRSGVESNVPLKFDLTSAMAIPSLILGGATMSKACNQNAVIITAGNVEISVNKSGVDITGNVTINGNMTVTGTGKIGGITMNTHKHTGVHGETSGPH